MKYNIYHPSKEKLLEK